MQFFIFVFFFILFYLLIQDSFVAHCALNKTGTRQCIRAVWSTLQYVAVYCSTFLYICAWLYSSFHSSFEYTLRSTWSLNRPTQKRPMQFSVGLPQPVYALAYVLTQVIYRERKIFSLTLAQRRIC